MMGEIVKLPKPEAANDEIGLIWLCACGSQWWHLTETGDCICSECKTTSATMRCFDATLPKGA